MRCGYELRIAPWILFPNVIPFNGNADITSMAGNRIINKTMAVAHDGFSIPNGVPALQNPKFNEQVG